MLEMTHVYAAQRHIFSSLPVSDSTYITGLPSVFFHVSYFVINSINMEYETLKMPTAMSLAYLKRAVLSFL